MAPVTLSKIQTITIGSGGSANIEFTNIPQIYTDLKVVFSLRCANAASRSEGFNLRVGNNTIDTGSNYSLRYLQGSGTATAAGNLTSQTSMYFGEVNGQSSTSSVFSNGEIYIPIYTSSNYKSISVNNVQEDNQTGAYQHFIAGLWSNASAINIIRLSGTNNISQYSTATLYGIKSLEKSAYASGGEVTEINGYYIHTFKGSGTFTPTVPLTVEYLVVAGGGGGSGTGGGGAGGLRCTTGATGGGGTVEAPLSLNANTNYTVTVGSGGAIRTNGSNSVFSSITSTGGGGGNIGSVGNTNGNSGGSGGGAGIDQANTQSSGTGGSGTANQGYAGGSVTNSSRAGGGGGGAGAVGGSVVNTNNGVGNGGNGVTTSISGASTTYGGGGGAAGGSSTAGTGGTGGGGNGGLDSSTAGTANTGGGGGSGWNTGGSSGGSGVVIIRYRK